MFVLTLDVVVAIAKFYTIVIIDRNDPTATDLPSAVQFIVLWCFLFRPRARSREHNYSAVDRSRYKAAIDHGSICHIRLRGTSFLEQ